MPLLHSVAQISDLSGSPATRTITFTWRGQSLAIDLTDAEERAFTDVMRPYLRAARPVSTTPQSGLGSEQSRRAAYLRRVAEFARTHGYPLPNPCRPSPELERAYLASRSPTPTAATQ